MKNNFAFVLLLLALLAVAASISLAVKSQQKCNDCEAIITFAEVSRSPISPEKKKQKKKKRDRGEIHFSLFFVFFFLLMLFSPISPRFPQEYIALNRTESQIDDVVIKICPLLHIAKVWIIPLER